AWINKHNKSFGYFIDGHWQHPEGRQCTESKRPSTGEVLAQTLDANPEDINAAVASSQKAFDTWSNLSSHARARHLYSIARNLQKHQSLLAVVESLNCGKPTRETRNVDVPSAIRQFYHHAGWAEILNVEMRDWKPRGVTLIATDWTFPLMQLASFVGPALATGNTVVVIPSALTQLSTLLFAEVCAQAGLPPGVLNVLTGTSLDLLTSHTGVDKLVFFGSVADGQSLRQKTAGRGTSLSLSLLGRNPTLVFEEADLDSAVEGVIEAAFFNSGQSCHAGSRLLIQESVYLPLIKKLKGRMSKLTVGDNMDKNNDQGAQANPQMIERLSLLVSQAEAQGAEIFRSSTAACNKPQYFPPTLIESIQVSSPVYLDE
ncbi:unnamed protein product, partial [Candidula unifasciata]